MYLQSLYNGTFKKAIDSNPNLGIGRLYFRLILNCIKISLLPVLEFNQVTSIRMQNLEMIESLFQPSILKF